MKTSKDPTIFTVLFEDSAALLGLVVAFLGIYLGHRLDNPYLDGTASVIIGLILALVAVMLAYESKGLLVGESANPIVVEKIRSLAEGDPAVQGVASALTMRLGPHEILLTMDVQFQHDLSAADIAAAVKRLEDAIRADHPDVKRIFIEAAAMQAQERGKTKAGP